MQKKNDRGQRWMAITKLSLFISRGSISGRVTRNSQQLNIPLCKTATGQKSFYYRIVSLWNAICPKIKLSPSVSSFKRNLKSYLLKQFLA